MVNHRPDDVLRHYPAALRGPLVALGNHRGFSGARLWRLDIGTQSYCLKAWPTDGRSPAELAWIHGLMAKAAALPWIPRVLTTTDGATFVRHHDRIWELLTWMPGEADFDQAPSPARLQSACTALAKLHVVWGAGTTRNEVCPAIRRRLHSLEAWRQLLQSGWRLEVKVLDPYAPLAEELWRLVHQQIEHVPAELMPWLKRNVPLQPCVCDPWHDHVLFTGDTVTGLIDFGSVKEDHVAVDLARMLGSMVGDDAAMWDDGLAAYERIRPLSSDEGNLARDLDRSGTILATTHWLRWLYHEGRRYDHPEAVVSRLTALARRLRSISPGREP